MSAQFQDVLSKFDWQPQPAAAEVVETLLARCLESSSDAAVLRQRMYDQTGTRLADWVDSMSFAAGESLASQLTEAGFSPGADDATAWRHPAGMFPVIRLLQAADGDDAAPGTPMTLAIKAASVDDFATAMAELGEVRIGGQAGGQFRVATLDDGAEAKPHAAALVAIERHGWPGFSPPTHRAQQIAAAAKHRQALAERRREFDDSDEGFRHAGRLFAAAEADVGRDWACDLFFAAERDYWMSRNAAARVQYERQQRLGLGWGNHDHHTYRSSRECFSPLIGVLEQMGFTCRERFYAGREAGWGAQVLEHAAAGVVIFADVDLTPEEVAGDFAHEALEPQPELGTVGLWCKLHGEAFLQAGMHHLECQFDFDELRRQLAAAGIVTLTPFTDWDHLKQAFTRGEIWPVAPERIQAALDEGYIDAEQADQFRREGAIGSHLEILERNHGFKGFNQTGISEIIKRTDPRHQVASA